MTAIIGIDPGLSGAIAFVAGEGAATVDSTPTVSSKKGKAVRRDYNIVEMRDLLLSMRDPHVVAFLEQVSAMPGQGVTSMFSFGRGVGLWEGLLVGLGIPFERVTPQRWKGSVLAGTSKDKGAAILRAQQLFPGVKIGKSDGKAEALLIATYGLRVVSGREGA